MKKRLTSIFTLLLYSLLLLSACSRESAGPTDTSGNNTSTAESGYVLKVGYGGILCEAPLHIAVEQGFFEEEGLEVDLVLLAPGTANEAVAAGTIEAGFSLLAAQIAPLANGLPIKITTGLHTGCDKILVPADSGINSIEDLRGKRIGVSSLTASPAIITMRALAAAGVGVTTANMEVEFVVYTNSELPLALQNGAVDVIAMNDPTAYIAAQEYGLSILLDSATDEPWCDQYCCVAYVRENIAEEYPEIAAKYTRAMQKAAAWVSENSDETARIQVENNWVQGNAEGNAEILKTYNYIPAVSKVYEAFGPTALKLQEIGLLDASVDINELWENSFAFFDDVPDTVTASDLIGVSAAASVTELEVKSLTVQSVADLKTDESGDCCK